MKSISAEYGHVEVVKELAELGAELISIAMMMMITHGCAFYALLGWLHGKLT